MRPSPLSYWRTPWTVTPAAVLGEERHCSATKEVEESGNKFLSFLPVVILTYFYRFSQVVIGIFFLKWYAAVSPVVVVKEIIKKTNNIPREFCEWCWKVKWRRHVCWQSRRPSREAIRCFAVEGLRMTKAPADCATWKSAPAQAPPSNLWRSLF